MQIISTQLSNKFLLTFNTLHAGLKFQQKSFWNIFFLFFLENKIFFLENKIGHFMQIVS